MRILLIATCPYLFVRGKSLRVHANVMALSRLGHQVTVLTYRDGSEVQIPNVRLKRTPAWLRMRKPQKTGPSFVKGISDVVLFLMGVKELSAGEYHLIVAEDTEGMMIGHLLKRRFHLPVIMDLHGNFSEILKNNVSWIPHPLVRVSNTLEAFLLRQGDYLICNWPFVRDRAQRAAPDVPKQLLFDTPPDSVYGVLAEPFPATPLGQAWRDRIKGKHLVYYAGNVSRYHNFQLALQGFRCALEKGLRNTVLLAVGDGFYPYVRQAEDLGIREHVHFIGAKPPHEASDLSRLADVCLSLIYGDGNPPSKIIYYLLAGRPILACDSEAHRQLLSDGYDAVFCKNTPESFADKLLGMIHNPSMQSRLARNAVASAAKFQQERIAAGWETALQTVGEF